MMWLSFRYLQQVDNQVQIVQTSMNRRSSAVNTTNEDETETDLENRGSCADITDEKQKVCTCVYYDFGREKG